MSHMPVKDCREARGLEGMVSAPRTGVELRKNIRIIIPKIRTIKCIQKDPSFYDSEIGVSSFLRLRIKFRKKSTKREIKKEEIKARTTMRFFLGLKCFSGT